MSQYCDTKTSTKQRERERERERGSIIIIPLGTNWRRIEKLEKRKKGGREGGIYGEKEEG